MSVKRYTLEMVSSEAGDVHWMHDNGEGLNAPIGDYVLHSDYAALLAEVERLTEDNRQLAKAIEIADGVIKRMGNAAKEGKPSV